MTHDPRTQRLLDLIDAANDGRIDEAGTAELDAMLRDDPQMQRAYLDYNRFDGALAWEFGLARRESTPAASPEAIARRRVVIGRIGFGAIAAAAALLMVAAIVAVYLIAVRPGSEASRPAVAVGVITETVDAAWRTDPLAAGDSVNRGDLSIGSGMVRMTLNSGVELTVLGPARVSMETAMATRLDAGRVYASVPKRAVGYTVRAPGVGVVDRGTRFGVDARSGSTEVHVFAGLVEVHAGGSVTPYEAGEAAAIVAGRIVDEPTPDIERFTYRVAPRVRYAHFGFDDVSANAIRVGGVQLATDRTEVVALPLERPAEIVDGFVGSAIRFEGDGQFLKTDVEGVSGDAARTVAAWVRLPENATPDGAYAIVAWGAPQKMGAKWQVSWNKLSEQGAMGALRCEVSGGYVIGSTDLRDGRWHHVAVVYPGGTEKSNAIRLYVDGRRETLSGMNATIVDTHGVERGGIRVLVGGFLNGNSSLRGDVDELYIIERAFTDEQVARLVETNQLETALIEP